MGFLFLSIGILLVGAFLSLFTKEDRKLKLCSIFTLFAIITLMHPVLKVLTTGKPLGMPINFSPFFGSVFFAIDALSAFFLLVISFMGFAGILYANGYLKPYINSGREFSAHCFFLMLLIASMIGVVTVQNSLFFLIIWEIMSLSSFFLVIFEGEKKEVLKAGIKYLVYMHLSVIFLIIMAVLLTNATSSFSIIDYSKALTENSQLANLVFLFGFLGFGIKAGFVPFHNWLPDAHPAAPTHVSAIMSGVMIKTGIYGIFRLLNLMGTPTKAMAYTVLGVALVTVIYGILYAITQRDIKRLLAYSSIENIGIIGLGLAIGMLGSAYSNNIVSTFGYAGALLHVLNHSIFKELMFFAAGSIYLKTHTRNIESLGGLIKKMPYTGLLFLIGSIAICGLPPFNGFVSEILIYAGMLLGLPSPELSLFITLIVSISGLALVGTMAMLCFSKAAGMIFLGESRTDAVKRVDGDVSAVMILPMSILAFATFYIGVFPHYIMDFILTPVSLFLREAPIKPLLHNVASLVQTLSLFFLLFLLIFILIFVIRYFMNKKSTTHVTWGCGYDKPNPHMQYTSSSYVNLFVSTLKPLFKRVSHVKKPKDLFPREAYYEVEIEDIEEAYIVKPLIKWDEKLLTKFERIQNGNIQQYILFGLIFLVVAIIGVIFIG